ncbi:MAG: hypothetical protein QOF41_3254, partial [Methylobacteriaceae bacterium]|nr:hypothetical protein [Methylobacteriaceae bacterium]
RRGFRKRPRVTQGCAGTSRSRPAGTKTRRVESTPLGMERLIFNRSIEVRDAELVQVAAMGRRETGSLHKTIGDPASRVLLVSFLVRGFTCGGDGARLCFYPGSTSIHNETKPKIAQ